MVNQSVKKTYHNKSVVNKNKLNKAHHLFANRGMFVILKNNSNDWKWKD